MDTGRRRTYEEMGPGIAYKDLWSTAGSQAVENMVIGNWRGSMVLLDLRITVQSTLNSLSRRRTGTGTWYSSGGSSFCSKVGRPAQMALPERLYKRINNNNGSADIVSKIKSI